MNYSPNESIDRKFAVLNLQHKRTSTGDPYLSVELSSTEGIIQGRVWSESLTNISLTSQSIYQIKGHIDMFQGQPTLNIKSSQHLPDESIESYLKSTPTMVFDIETLGQDFQLLDHSDQEYFLTRLEQNFQGDEQHLHTRTGLYPMYGSVLTIGFMDYTQKTGQVLYVSSDHTQYQINNFKSVSFATEAEMLKAFWELCGQFDRFVTFNGSGFDFPFLAYRSAVNRIVVPFETNGQGEKFVDLSHKFRMNSRSFKLEVICKSLGITNPKQDGVSGMEVANLYKQGRMEEIVKYVSRDVTATSELYEIWSKYLAGKLII